MVNVLLSSSRIWSILVALAIFIVFAANALFLQPGFRSETILDGLDLPLPRTRVVPYELALKQGRTGIVQSPSPSFPLPLSRPDAGSEVVGDRIEMLLTNTQTPSEFPSTIVYVKQMLNKLGYGLTGDNDEISNSVRNAILRFESDRKLPLTGKINEALIRELGRVSAVPMKQQ
ncbi:MAG: peptidoglycan-binding domain-containing protein [Hyphomicrobiales bacterium]